MTTCATMRRGVVLIWALITLTVVTTILGAVATYNGTLVRSFRRINDYNGEYTLFAGGRHWVDQQLEQLNPSSGGEAAEETIERYIERLRGLNGKKFSHDDYSVVFNVEGLDGLKEKLQSGAKVKIVATVYRKGVGGIEVVSKKFEKEVTFALEQSGVESGLGMHPIFNYCYFANNRGHLESPYSAKIIVNGEVGSNDRFTINGATVNGYVWAHAEANGRNAVELKGSPHIWAYPTYQMRVVREYLDNKKEFFTPVRPTNPVLSNGKEVVWKGGYEAPGTPNVEIEIGEDASVSYIYYGDAFEPQFNNNVKKGTNPGEKPKAVPMPMPSEKNLDYYVLGVFWISKYRDYIAKWLKSTWFAGMYDGISTSDIPSKKVTWSWSEYDKQVQAWATKKKINIAGEPNPSVVAAWNEANAVYTNYTAYVESFNAAHDDWLQKKNKYLADLQSTVPEEGEILTLNTKHVDSEGNATPIISSTTNVVAMPNVSDAASYRAFCQNFTNTQGNCSSLICENRYRTPEGIEQNIVWERTVYDKTVWTKSEVGIGLGEYAVGTVLRTETNISDKVTISRTLANISITHGYADDIYPFERRAADGSYLGSDTNYEGLVGMEVKRAERGSVILLGTLNNPIRINGPTYIDGDVVIRGFVTGQGTIYSGRNIHIIGDITYLNPPHWPHSTSSLNKSTPEATKEINQKRDSLTLIARGNIIVGNYSDSEWMGACKTWMQKGASDANYVSNVPCCNDFADDEIGYGTFNHDYTALEGGTAKDQNEKIVWDYADKPYLIDAPKDGNMFDTSYWKYITDYMVRAYVCDKNKYRMVPKRTTGERRFYECKLGSELINDLMQQSVSAKVAGVSSTGFLNWLWSGRVVLQWVFRSILGGQLPQQNIDYENISFDVAQVTSAVAGDANAGDIVQIDAVLFANHGIFGRVGGSASHKFKLHGGMVCRDEGLLPSFAERFKNNSGAAAWVNWDMRIKADSAEGLVGTGIPGNISKTVEKRETAWRQTR